MWVEKKYTESVVFMKKALEIDEFNSEYLLTLAKVFIDNNYMKGAEIMLKKAAKLDPENSEIWLTAADTCTKSGDLQKALKIMRKAVIKNEDPVLKYRLVGLLLESKIEKEAFELLYHAMEQEFVQISSLYEFYPKALKNKRLKRIVDNFKQKNVKH